MIQFEPLCLETHLMHTDRSQALLLVTCLVQLKENSGPFAGLV